jgi:hypothetical protein
VHVSVLDSTCYLPVTAEELRQLEAAAAPAAAPAITPPKAQLAPIFSAALPQSMGPWLAKCVERWGLGPPYDSSCSEAHWRAYYKERAALDFLLKAYRVRGSRL